MNTAVVYRSSYGHTRQYAQWAAESLGTTEIDLDSEATPSLQHTDVLVALLPIYAAKVSGAKEFTRLVETFPTVPVVLGCVGASGTEPGKGLGGREAAVRASLPQALVERRAHVFQLPGGINYERLGIRHAAMMKLINAKLLLDAKRSGNPETVARVRAQTKSSDHTERAALEPLLAKARALGKAAA